MVSPRPTLSSPLTRGSARRRLGERGFALLITITLLAFLVILLVGLATYTRVETAVAGNTQRQAQARQNALLALNVAVGQLQKYAGPDLRVTATAETQPGAHSQKIHYTGVWRSDPTAPTDPEAPAADPLVPLAWLVSGVENGAAVDITTAIPVASRVALTGPKTDRTTFQGNGNPGPNNVVAPLQPITAPGVPGQPAAATPVIGRYAWWIGDQGVKAPVAVPDSTASVTHAPWDTADARLRLRQQIPLGAGATTAAGAPVFDPRDAASSPLASADKVVSTNQLAFLRTASPTGAAVATTATAIGLTTVQDNFHNWSPNNFAVLASTAPASAGLKRDLSLDPTLLGTGFATWADYASYMEPPVPVPADAETAPLVPPPSPDYNDTNPVRRRYTMQAPAAVGPGEVARNVAPILNYFLLSFNLRTQAGSTAVRPIEARARWMLSLWNPYTAALVPENLRVEVTGLPVIRVDNTTTPTFVPPIPLQVVYGSSGLPDTPLNLSLPWDSTSSTAADRQSWLPGRTYAWTSVQDLTAAPSDAGYTSRFYSRNLLADAGQGVQRLASSVTIDGDDMVHLHGNPTVLEVKLYTVRASGDVLVATFRSPEFSGFTTTPQRLNAGSYQFSYLFRLAESIDGAAWLTTPNSDLRAATLASDKFVAGANGPFPELYPDYSTISEPDRLLDRATNGLSYNEDTPIFEFPRGPLLSLGALQHLPLADRRPFSIGNSWGVNEQLNGVRAFELFDRFFFSGLSATATPAIVNGAPLLPNPLLKVIPRVPTTGAPIDVATDLIAAPGAQSSRYLLQGGAFNFNSTRTAAWLAVLRSVRFPAPQAFRYLNSSHGSGTTGDTSLASVTSADAQFFRFPHSAHETYKADPTYAASTIAAPDTPDVASAANTHLFRQGMRTLDASQLTGLAEAIVTLIRTRHTTAGPFLTLEEFLTPAAGATESLLEQAIATAAWTNAAGEARVGLNADIPEFSSQWLTQGDLLTALAPVLFPRSDTFVVRTYGEAVNPATGVTDGRAWCEAIVQRVPEYFDKSEPEETPPASLSNPFNQAYGRRFKVVSFRWLTRSDI